MSEIKHTFAGGKMNKDLDERLVPNGEFRDAENVQVRTSETDAIGTVQNIKGTAELGASYFDSSWMVEDDLATSPIAVASIPDEKTNKAYFFFASPPVPTLQNTQFNTVMDIIDSERVFIDSIVEQDLNGNTFPVVVDRHTVINTRDEVLPTAVNPDLLGSWTSFQVLDASKYRVGMTVKALAPTNLVNYSGELVDLFTNYVTEGGLITMNSDWGNGAKIKAIDLETNTITLYEEQFTDFEGCVYLLFEAERVLNFQGNIITGVNVIDDLLFWTDNLTEPKKINITRCKEGSVDFETHTKLHVKHPILSSGPSEENYVSINTVNPGLSDYPVNQDLQEHHITVMRQTPRTAPTLEMSRSLRDSNVSADFNWTFTDGTADLQAPDPEDEIIIESWTFSETDWNAGDRLDISLTNQGGGIDDDGGFNVTFISYVSPTGQEVDGPTDYIKLEINSVIPPIIALEQQWTISLKQRKPLFELKLARFGYRYKYEDGEYSAFSPWSELAFLPGEFDLVIRKAYNLGMVNHIRELIIKDFIPYKKPMDVVAVDLLYKESSKPNVYVVKTIERTRDDDWEMNSPSFVNSEELKTGRLKITSEMIHKVLPSSQTLRAWDNIPRFAKAQEITANRLVYGNYIQGYPLNTPVTLKQLLKSDTTPTLENPQKSVKSIRHYKWGMVFGDRYGRETPVIESGNTETNSSGETQSVSGDIVVEKALSSFRNFFELQQNWNSISVANGVPPDWIDYVKYYVKEVSNEYYNMVMDRWYWADEEKDNVWISFNSADRNKVDEETYLILKNQHGNHNAVDDKARFKIIAIENDAPDFIKTVRRPIGRVEIFPANMNRHFEQGGVQLTQQTGWGLVNNWETYIPADQPEGLMLNTTCQIYMANWNETISGWAPVEDTSDPVEFAVQDFSNSIFGRRIDGNIKMRIVGDNGIDQMYSSWRSLYHYRFVDKPQDPPDTWNGGGGVGDGSGAAFEYWQQKIELNWDTTWQDEAFMYERFVNAYGNATNLKMYLEFIEDDIDHRPQFDGKFFVKLEKNLELETNVLYSDGSGGLYVNKSVHGYVKLDNPFKVDCTTNIQTRMFWNEWTFPAWGDLLDTGDVANAMGAFPFIDEFQPFYARFFNIPNGSNDPDLPGWTTQDVIFGQGYESFEGGLQNVPNVIGLARIYLSSSEINVNNEGGSGFSQQTWVDYNNDGWSDQDFLGYNVPLTQGINNPAEAIVDTWLMKMRTVGTQFRFSSNPGQIFEVIDAERGYGPGNQVQASPGIAINLPRNYGGAVPQEPNVFNNQLQAVDYVTDFGGPGDCEPCGGPDGNGNGACFRKMIRVDFRLVNQDSNQPIMDTGLIGFDPTSGLNASGGGSNRNIYIVEPHDIFGSPGIKTELGGCWETEPKEDVDIDLYYEASNAVPMRLTEKNAFDFAPINSKVSIRRWVTEQDADGNDIEILQDVSLTNENHKVANIEFLNDTPLIYITSEQWGTGDVVPHIYDISPDPTNNGEIIVFTHPDGTETMSSVIGEYAPNADPIDEAISNGSGSVPFVPEVTIYREMTVTNMSSNYIFISNIDDLEVGMNIFSINGEVEQFASTAGVTTTNNSSIIPNGYQIIAINEDNLWNPPGGGTPWTGVKIGPPGSQLGLESPWTWDETAWDTWAANPDNTGNPGIANNDLPYTFAVRISSSKGYYEIDPEVWKYKIKLAWHNCYSFGNGVESDRIRDDYNALQIDNGVRVSTTFSGYGVEHKSSGLIHSGLYNSTSEVNDLNEFNMGEKIMKDLNPIYGSIQALKTRDTDVVIFAEDKVLRVIANKDAVYNADGNPQLIATNRTLGQVIPYGGDFGISQNPESLAVDQYRMYFTDKQRGTVCRLSMDGITPISNAGMKSWFRENLRFASSLRGSFDDVNGEYNLTLNYDPALSPIVPEPEDNIGTSIDNWTKGGKTVSFNEGTKGWVSFKSFIPQTGTSLSSKYITARNNKIWEHYRDFAADGVTPIAYNNFYGQQYESRFKVVFNDMPSVVKHFNTINYEGTQSYVAQNLLDNEYYNLTAKEGWYVNSFDTDLQSGFVNEFIDKENKWFNRIQGKPTTLSNIDTSEFTVQGLGVPVTITGDYVDNPPSFVFVVTNWYDDPIDESTTLDPSNPSESSTYEE